MKKTSQIKRYEAISNEVNKRICDLESVSSSTYKSYDESNDLVLVNINVIVDGIDIEITVGSLVILEQKFNRATVISDILTAVEHDIKVNLELVKEVEDNLPVKKTNYTNNEELRDEVHTEDFE